PAHSPPRGGLIARNLLLDLEGAPEGLLGARVVARIVAERTEAIEEGVRPHVTDRGELAGRVDHGLGPTNGAGEAAGGLPRIGGRPLALEPPHPRLPHAPPGGGGPPGTAPAPPRC